MGHLGARKQRQGVSPRMAGEKQRSVVPVKPGGGGACNESPCKVSHTLSLPQKRLGKTETSNRR